MHEKHRHQQSVQPQLQSLFCPECDESPILQYQERRNESPVRQYQPGIKSPASSSPAPSLFIGISNVPHSSPRQFDPSLGLNFNDDDRLGIDKESGLRAKMSLATSSALIKASFLCAERTWVNGKPERPQEWLIDSPDRRDGFITREELMEVLLFLSDSLSSLRLARKKSLNS
jgi:hypothetical protein